MAEDGYVRGLTSIVAIDMKGAIGCRNALPWSLKSDMAFFRRQTLGNTVIMGRKTYESIGGQLPGRRNIVLSHNNVLFQETDDCKLALSVPEALFYASSFDEKMTYIIGGAVTYSQFADLVDKYIVTVVNHIAGDADSFLAREVFSQLAIWDRNLIEKCRATDGKDQYDFEIYEIISPDIGQRRLKQAAAIKQYRSKIPKGLRKKSGSNPRTVGTQVAFGF